MKAVILAAGKGERLRPLTETRPKPLIPLAGKTLLQRTLEILARIGVEEAIIVAGYRRRDIEKALETYRNTPPTRIIDQGEPLGTGHALLAASHLLSEEFLLIYGDLMVSETALRRVVRAPHSHVVAAVRVEEPWRYGVLEVDEKGFLRRIVEKPPRGTEPSNLVNAGVYKLGAEVLGLLEDLKPSPRGELELTDALTALAMSSGVRVVELDRQEWFEIGYPWDILDAAARVLGEMEPGIKGEVERGAVVKGPVYVEHGAVVRSGSYIVGPAYIGREASIGPNCYIRGPVSIEKGARIGNAVEVKASLIMEHARISHLSYVGDSVVGEHVNLGAGTVTANLRFDDKEISMVVKGKRVSSRRRKLGAFIGGYAKTGINVSIMPGVRIGSYSWIMPGSIVVVDVPPRMIYKSAGYKEYELRKLRLPGEEGSRSQ